MSSRLPQKCEPDSQAQDSDACQFDPVAVFVPQARRAFSVRFRPSIRSNTRLHPGRKSLDGPHQFFAAIAVGNQDRSGIHSVGALFQPFAQHRRDVGNGAVNLGSLPSRNKDSRTLDGNCFHSLRPHNAFLFGRHIRRFNVAGMVYDYLDKSHCRF